MCAGLPTFVAGEYCVGVQLARSNSHHRENRTQEVDAYLAEGKIPVDVDLSQHPEKSVEARGCMSLMPLTESQSSL